LRIFKQRELPQLPLGFWTWHDHLKDTHAAHTDDEMETAFAAPGFDEEGFLTGARAVLDALRVLWMGLMATRGRKVA